MQTLLKLTAAALLAWATAAPAAAAPPPANLNIVAERGQPFSLVLDGRVLTRPVARQVHVDLLMPGRHFAEFSLPAPYGPPLRYRTAVWLQPGLETSFVLQLRPYGPQLRQVDAVPVGRPGYGQGGYYGPGTGPYGGGGGYPGGGQLPAPGPNGGYGYDDGHNAPGYDPRGTYPGNEQPGPYPAPTPTPVYPGNNGGGNYPVPPTTNPSGGYYPGSGVVTNLRPLTPSEAAGLTQALRQQAFDDNRLPIVKQALAQSSLRADELAALVRTLTYDKSQVELASFGYAHVSDPQNFYRVYDALTFKTSVRDVQQAIGVQLD